MTNQNKDAVPERAIEAAAEALYAADPRLDGTKPFTDFPVGSFWGDRYRDEARAALSAALPFLSQSHEGIGVKALEWEPADDENDPSWEVADTVIGRYAIEEGQLYFYASVQEEIERIWLADEGDLKAQAQTDYATRIRSALSPIPSPHGEAATLRHVKRGTEYVLIGFGKMQAESWLDMDRPTVPYEAALVDMREVAIYRSVDDGSLWVRPREEFEDGRFEPVPRSELQPKEPGNG